MKVSDFHYELPLSAIAQTAIEPRHDSRLLDTRDLSDHRFFELPELLSPGDLLIVNSTRVRAARLVGRRASGGKVELLLLDRRSDHLWECLARPARKLRSGDQLDFDSVKAVVRGKGEDGALLVSLEADDEEGAIESIGSLPLPPYFTGTLDSPDRYQTLFADQTGSAAAPTAGLHFTQEVIRGLQGRGIELATVDLHVSVDTFRPMSSDTVEDHVMHSEWCMVPEPTVSAIADCRARLGRVVAVGTTVVRTLESLADGHGGVEAGSRRTDLFLRPGSHFTVVDALVTNFHLPGSTLLVMLAGFMGPGWHAAYEEALRRGYRFLSFGDAMYAERHDS